MPSFRLDAKAFTVLFRLFLMLVAVLLLNADRAKADATMDLSGGDSGCTDPVLSMFRANSMGGSCPAFTNLSGGGYNNLQITTSLALYDPVAGGPRTSDTFNCSPGDLFLNCGFSTDGGRTLFPSGTNFALTPGGTLTILFFGEDGAEGTHHGVPNDSTFSLNLNQPCSSTVPCTSGDRAGDWLAAADTGSSFQGAANVPDEPNMQILVLLASAWIMLGRRLTRGRRQGSHEPEREIS